MVTTGIKLAFYQKSIGAPFGMGSGRALFLPSHLSPGLFGINNIIIAEYVGNVVLP